MSDINVTVDYSELINATQTLLNLNARQRRSFRDLMQTTVDYNSAGDATRLTIKGIVDANKEMHAVLVKTENGWQTANASIKATASSLERYKDKLNSLNNTKVQRALTKLFPSNNNLNFDEFKRVEKLRSAILSLDNVQADPKIIKNLVRELRAGNIPEATGQLGKLRDKLAELISIERRAQARVSASDEKKKRLEDQAKAAENATVQLKRLTDAYLASIAKAAKVDLKDIKFKGVDKNSIRRLQREIKDALLNIYPTLDNKQLTKFFNSFRKGKFDENAIGDTGKAQRALGDLVAKYKEAVEAARQLNRENARAATEAQRGAGRSTQVKRYLKTSALSTLANTFNQPLDELTIKQTRALSRAFEEIAAKAQDSKKITKQAVKEIFESLMANPGNIKLINNKDLRAAADEITRVIALFETLDASRRRAAQINQNSLNQRTQSSQEERNYNSRVNDIRARFQDILRPTSDQLRSVSPRLDLSQSAGISRTVRSIAELATKVGLTNHGLESLYNRFKSGSLSGADSQYARLIETFQRLESQINSAKRAANNFAARNGTVSPFANDPNIPPSRASIGAAREFEKIWTRIKTTLGYFVTYKAFGGITESIKQSILAAREYQIQISLIRTISQDAQLSFGQWQKEIQGVSDAMGIDFKETAQAFYDAVSNQVVKGASTAGFISSAANLARTTQSSLTDSQNLLSSAITTYGYDITDAEVVSAKFFKTIDLGRIKAGDLANTFGRVAFMGKALGVEFEEILAIMAALTRRGITTQDAITLITNGMNKLAKPTEGTAKLLNSWGFPSGEAATRVRGFTNVLLDMIEASERGQISLTEIFNEIRSQKLIEGFKISKDDILSDLSIIKDENSSTYTNAKEIRGESDSDRITKELTKFHNLMSTNFGSTLLSVAGKIINISGGVEKLSGAVKGLAKATLTGVTAWAAYKTAVALSTVQMSRLSLAIKANPVGLLASTVAAGLIYWQTQNVELESFIKKTDAAKDLIAEMKTAQEKLNQTIKQKPGDVTKDNALKSVKEILEVNAKAIIATTNSLDAITTKSSEVGESLKVAFGAYLDEAKGKLKGIANEFNNIDERIQRSARSGIDFKQKIDDILFSAQRRYANQDQLPQLIDTQMAKTQERIKALYKQGTESSVAEARQLFGSLAQLSQEKFDAQQDNQQYRFEQGLQNGQLGSHFYRKDSRGRVVRGVKLEPLMDELGAIKQLHDSLEQKYTQQVESTRVPLSNEIIRQKQNMRELEAAIKEFSELKLYNDDKTVNSQFKDSFGKADFNKFKAKQKEIIDRIKKYTDPNISDAPEITTLFNKLEERMKLIEQELALEQQKRDLIDTQRKGLKASEDIQDNRSKAKKRVTEGTQDLRQTQLQIQGLADQLKLFSSPAAKEGITSDAFRFNEGNTLERGATKLSRALVNAYNNTTGRIPGMHLITPEEKLGVDELDTYYKGIDMIMKELEDPKNMEKNENGQEMVKPQVLKDVIRRLGAVENKIRAVYRRTLGTDQLKFEATGQTLPQATEMRNFLNNKVDTGLESLKAGQAALENANLANQVLINNLSTTQTSLNSVGTSATIAGSAIVAAYESSSNNIQATNQQIMKTIQLLESMQNNAAGALVGGAMSAPVRRAYGGPIGSDNQLGFFKAGEYVLNEEATSQYYSQIQAMNTRARTPQNFSNDVSVGAMTVNVNESSTPGLTAQSVMGAFKRAKRLGR